MNQAIDNLRALTNCKHILLTESGDHAILLGMMACRKLSNRKNFIIPDQGGWFSYKKYPKRLGFEIVEIKTDYGIIDLDDLRGKIKDMDSAAFIYTNPAGYFAEQPSREIYSLCKDKCLVIKDISGCIGDEKLCISKDADVVVCSFNEWKPINLGYGGFIGTNSERFFSAIDNHEGKFDEKCLERLIKLLENLPNRMKMLYEITERVKRDLKGFKIIHPDKKGINVIVRFDSDEEKARILEYCYRNSLEFTLCPRYIRVNEKAVSVEVKRMG